MAFLNHTACLTLCIGVLFVLPAEVRGQTQNHSAARQLLTQTREHYQQTSGARAQFHQRVHNPLLERTRTGTGTWRFQDSQHWSLTFEEPEGDLILADGRFLWLHYPSTHPGQVLRRKLQTSRIDRASGVPAILQQVLGDQYQMHVETLATSSDHETVHLRFEAREPDHPTPQVQLWIDPVDKWVERLQWIEHSGTRHRFRFRKLQTITSFPEGTFRFAVPDTIEVFRAGGR